ncbi:MAG: TetR/AcrR family transcriptional regulator [Syntrophomonas sp.]|nr:TetR/AcrR family transcriptional regulator [Syntrophomonas sp.]
MKAALNNLSTKEKILHVAMAIIAEEGFQNITVRKIAAKAGVNIAAVNYHFGSKDAVINEALRHVTDQLKKNFEYLSTSNEDPKTKLSIFVNNYTEIMFEYPDIIRHLVIHAINNKQLDSRQLDQREDYLAFLQTEGISLVKETVRQIRPDQDDHFISLKTLHLISSLSFRFLLGERIFEVFGVDMSNEEIHKMHTKIILENVCRK